jgi:hypothetical protein
MSNSTSGFICPSPLVYLTDTNHKFSTVESIYYDNVTGTDCVVPCPTLIYGIAYWGIQKISLTVLIIFSAVVSGVVWFSHLREFTKYYIRVMFISGFFGYALVLSIFACMNLKNNSVVCANSSRYTPHNGMYYEQSLQTAASTVLMLGEYLGRNVCIPSGDGGVVLHVDQHVVRHSCG